MSIAPPTDLEPVKQVPDDLEPILSPVLDKPAPDTSPTSWNSLNESAGALPSGINPEWKRTATLQKYVGAKVGFTDDMVTRNWDGVKSGYIHHELGMPEQANMSDEALFNAIDEHEKNGGARALENIRKLPAETPKEAHASYLDWINDQLKKTTLGVFAGGDGDVSDGAGLSEKPMVNIPELKLKGDSASRLAEVVYGMGYIPQGVSVDAMGYSPEVVNAIVNKIVAPAAEFLTTPKGAALTVAAIATRGTGVGKLIEGYFGYAAAKGVVEASAKGYGQFLDPNTTKKEFIDTAAEVAGSSLMLTGIALHSITEGLPRSQGDSLMARLRGRPPAEQANILRVEANRVPPEKAPVFHQTAGLLDGMYPMGDAPVMPLKIESPAIKTADGRIVEGANHAAIGEKGVTGEEGFTTSTGEFVGRKRAMEIAKEAGQVGEEHADKTELHSHMVDMPESRRITAAAEVEALSHANSEEHAIGVKRLSADAELQRMGMEPLAEADTKKNVVSLAESKARFASDAETGQKLLRRIKAGDKRFNDSDSWDSIVETRRLADEVEVAEKRYDEALQSGDETAVKSADMEVREKRAAFGDAMETFNSMGGEGGMGTTLGRALQARRNMLKADYTLAALERKYRKASANVDIPAGVRADLETKANRISELESALKRSQEERAKSRPPAQPRITKTLAERLSNQATLARQRITARMAEGRLQSGLDPADVADHAIIAADYMAKGIVKTAELTKKLVDELGERIRPHIDEILAKASEIVDKMAKDESKLKSWRTRTSKEIDRLIQTGEPKPKRVPLELPFTKEDLAMKQEIERLKRDVDKKMRAAEEKRRPNWLKGAEGVAWFGRTMLLTSFKIIPKIAAASLIKMLTAIPKEAIGVIASKLTPEAAKLAPLHAQPTWAGMASGEFKAIKGALTKGIRGAAESLKVQPTTEELLFVPDIIPPSGRDYVTQVHKALHYPALMNEFERRVNTKENSIRAKGEGTSLQEPAVWSSTRTQAYNESMRMSYMEKDGLLSRSLSWVLKGLEDTARKQDRDSLQRKLAATAVMIIRLDNPVIKVGANIAGQTFEGLTGAVTGTAQIAEAYRKGFEGMKEGDLDAAYRRLKNGAFTWFAMYATWQAVKHLPNNFLQLGGSPAAGEPFGKVNKDGLEEGTMKVGEHEIPRVLMHNETMNAVQMLFAHKRLMEDQYGEDFVIANSNALFRVAMGAMQDVPGVKESILGKVSRTKEPLRTTVDWFSQRMIPPPIRMLAYAMDTGKPLSPESFMEKPTKRYAGSAEDVFKLGIPGLRQQVPTYRNPNFSLLSEDRSEK